jgi:hypothetical protein
MTINLPAVTFVLISGVYACGSSSADDPQHVDEHAAHRDAGGPEEELLPPSALDHPISHEDSTTTDTSPALQAACADGDNYCNGTSDRCIACCNSVWYDINTCQYGVNFYCNGYHYNAYNCWPIASPPQE